MTFSLWSPCEISVHRPRLGTCSGRRRWEENTGHVSEIKEGRKGGEQEKHSLFQCQQHSANVLLYIEKQLLPQNPSDVIQGEMLGAVRHCQKPSTKLSFRRQHNCTWGLLWGCGSLGRPTSCWGCPLALWEESRGRDLWRGSRQTSTRPHLYNMATLTLNPTLFLKIPKLDGSFSFQPADLLRASTC